jgi:hypothetical protein
MEEAPEKGKDLSHSAHANGIEQNTSLHVKHPLPLSVSTFG